MTEALPKGVVHYATSRFTHETLPEKLRKDHSTKAGVWGQLAVQHGQLLLSRDDKGDLVLGVGATAVFAPQETHSVNPIGEVEFEVRFHRQEAPDAA
ncbi:DUF1971 domain-containing protein [Ruegeria faecimaris]|uniref:Uncharacterized protein, possibly involved in tellurite resistance n=1 Tax=Ruegeria faecimaris TaxID=686389 RepID=A0A521DNZ2_9RHOB|nr:DUF1971 domain-containing protein [Ruegeria faecimaris]SMO73312.1 Uncharacterized protein, possibly involved in tellurite resistance [Ruegeria faecimaris]